MKRILSIGSTLLLMGTLTVPAMAQGYPSRNVTVIVPYPPGGSVDGVARILVQKLNETLGRTSSLKIAPAARPERSGRTPSPKPRLTVTP